MKPLPVPSRKYDAIAGQMHRDVLAGRFTHRMPGERVLSREYGVNFKTVRRAMACLEEQGLLKTERGEGRLIVPHAVRRQSRTVVQMTPMEGHLYADFTAELVWRLQEQGIGTLPVNPERFHPTSAELQRILAYHPIGLIASDHQAASRQMVNEQGQFFPRKVFWTQRWGLAHPDAVTLYADSFQGVYRATRHLIALGHRRILFVNHVWKYPEEERPHSTHDRMCLGYERALEEAGLLDQKRYLFLGAEESANVQAVRAVLREPAHQRPTGLIAYFDYLAVQAAHEARALGMRIPEDLALVGYHNTPWCQWNDVPLSSVSIREQELARLAAEAMTGLYEPGRLLTVEPELMVRRSSDPQAADDPARPATPAFQSALEVNA